MSDCVLLTLLKTVHKEKKLKTRQRKKPGKLPMIRDDQLTKASPENRIKRLL